MCGPGGCGRGPHARVRATAGSVVARLVVGCVRVWRRCERERERERALLGTISITGSRPGDRRSLALWTDPGH